VLGRARYSLLLCDSMEMVPASLTCGAARGAGCQGREVGRHGRGREVGRRAVGWHEGVRWERWKRWERGERRTESGERRAESGERRADSGERIAEREDVGAGGEERGEGRGRTRGMAQLTLKESLPSASMPSSSTPPLASHSSDSCSRLIFGAIARVPTHQRWGEGRLALL